MSRRNSLRLSRRHRAWLYGSTALLFATGAAWWALHRWGAVEGEFGSEQHPALPWLLKTHGGAAMAVLVVLGTLLPIHVKRSWAARKNRSSGAGLLSIFGILTVTELLP